MKNVLGFYSGKVAQLGEFNKNHWIVYSKKMNIMVLIEWSTSELKKKNKLLWVKNAEQSIFEA